MPTYEYQNARGKTFDIVLPMSVNKPEAILVLKGGDWKPCEPGTPRSYARVFTFAGSVKAPPAGVINEKGGLPVSRALPAKYRKKGDGSTVINLGGHKAVKHRDGALTDLAGRRVIRNREDRARATDQTGFKYHRDV